MRLLMLAALLLIPLASALAQDTDLAQMSRQITQAEGELRAIDAGLDERVDADARRALRARASAARQAATAATATLADQLAKLDAQIGGLGAASAAEAPEIRRQRKQLDAQRAAVDAAIRRGGLVDVQGRQLIDELDRSAAEQFTAAISTRVASPLSPGFWSAVLVSFPRDLRRVELFLHQGRVEIERHGRRALPWAALLGALAALIVLFPLRTRALRIGQRFLIEDAPARQVRRSGYAVWRVLVGTGAPLLAAAALVQGLQWSGLLPVRWSVLLDAFVGAAGFAGFSASVTGAVLARSQPHWRLAPIDDHLAARLRPLSLVLAGLAFVTLLVTSFNATIGASRAAEVAFEAMVVIAHLALIAAALVVLGRARAHRADNDDAASLQARAGLGLLELVAWCAVVVALGALLLGYVGLGIAIVQFITWAAVLGSATFLFTRAIDDIASTLLNRHSRLGLMFTRGLGLRGSAVDQFGLIVSGLLRAGVVVIALGLLVTPFGAGGGLSSLFGRLGAVAQGITVGGVAISPGAILRGIVVLLVGLGLLRAFLRWLDRRYLPATDLDGSGRNSVSLVARYVGIALAAIWALASLGIGIERIALLLSALSVGIGFGLQAITQNFISGLILLAERPIKIGDLIRVGSDEGDVKRISVRSTEIELGDHSTLIVPNSELITKSVVNKTLASPLGRVQIQFGVPIEADAAAVERILADAYAAEEAILAEPKPVIFIDAIAEGRITFNSFAHVSGPRAAYGARSNVFKTLLRGLREAGIDISSAPQRLELVGDRDPIAPDR